MSHEDYAVCLYKQLLNRWLETVWLIESSKWHTRNTSTGMREINTSSLTQSKPSSMKEDFREYVKSK